MKLTGKQTDVISWFALLRFEAYQVGGGILPSVAGEFMGTLIRDFAVVTAYIDGRIPKADQAAETVGMDTRAFVDLSRVLSEVGEMEVGK